MWQIKKYVQLSESPEKNNENNQRPSEFIYENRLTYLRPFTLKKLELMGDKKPSKT